MTESQEAPRLWVFAGPNGAGKTSLFNEMLRGQIDFINADEIATKISQVNPYLDVIQAGRIAVARRNLALKERRNLSIETTLSGNSAIRFMANAKKLGYRIDLAYVGLDSAELSSDRVEQRVIKGGHDVPADAIMRRFPDSMSKLKQAIRLADRAFIFDNSAQERWLLLIIENQTARWIGNALPSWLEGAVPPDLRKFKRSGGNEQPSIEI